MAVDEDPIVMALKDKNASSPLYRSEPVRCTFRQCPLIATNNAVIDVTGAVSPATYLKCAKALIHFGLVFSAYNKIF